MELTLPEGENIYAAEYSLYLPDKNLLQSKLAQWIEEFEEVQTILEIADGGDAEWNFIAMVNSDPAQVIDRLCTQI